MEILLWLVLGAVAGFLAVFAVYRSVPQTAWQWIGALLIGLVGGWLGGLLANLLGLASINWLGALVIAFVGALLVLLLLRNMVPQA